MWCCASRNSGSVSARCVRVYGIALALLAQMDRVLQDDTAPGSRTFA